MSLLLLSILYMASLGLVCPTDVCAAGTPAGTTIILGGNGGGPDTADLPGDVVAHYTSAFGNDTLYKTNAGGNPATPVSAVYGDTLASPSAPAAALPGETAAFDLVVANAGNAEDTIVFDSAGPPAPSFALGGPASASSNVEITFWNGPGTAQISNMFVPAGGSAAFKVRVYMRPGAPTGDTLTFTLTAKAKNGVGGDMFGYTGNNGLAYAGAGDATAMCTTLTSTPTPSSATNVAFIGGDTHLLAVGGFATITVVVKNSGGTPVPNAQVNFSISNPTAPTGASLSADSGITNASGQTFTTLNMGPNPASSYYRVKAQVLASGAFQNYYAYSDRLHFSAQDSTPGVGWKMWAPNKRPDTPATLSSVVLSDLPGATVYEWDANAASDNTYKQYKTPSLIQRGRAYWIKSPVSGNLDVFSIAPPDTATTVYDTLVGRGWHQIGSGQFFFVDWSQSVAFAAANSGGDAFYVPASAASIGLIKNAVYWRDGAGYTWGPDSALAGYTNIASVQMKPMTGFWMWVETTAAVVMKVSPTPAAPAETATAVLNQAPRYLSAVYQQQGLSGSAENWMLQLAAQSGALNDVQNYVGVMPTAQAASNAGLYEPPGVASGYLTLGIRDPDGTGGGAAGGSPLQAAAYAAPITTAKQWKVEVYTDVVSPVTISWDNVSSIPENYAAYLLTPAGAVDMRKASSMVLQSQIPNPKSQISMTLAVGLPQYVAAFLAAPLSKEESFAYPNPGPDAATGLINFKHNVISGGVVKIAIFDVGGRLVKELSGTASPVQWDTTNRSGQKVGSGVYIYMMESEGNKLVDKLAVVR